MSVRVPGIDIIQEGGGELALQRLKVVGVLPLKGIVLPLWEKAWILSTKSGKHLDRIRYVQY